jgi:hypothetical protein
MYNLGGCHVKILDEIKLKFNGKLDKITQSSTKMGQLKIFQIYKKPNFNPK